MRPATERGISLIEMAVIVGIASVLLAIGATSYFRYRANTAVNTGAETVEVMLMRAKEEAKTSGFALAGTLRQNGVATAAPEGRFGADRAVAVRVRKRYRAGGPVQMVATKDLSLAAPVEVEVAGLGVIDIDTDASQEGVFFEVLVKDGASATLLATVPVDVNGELILAGAAGNGAIRLHSGTYSRAIEVTRRGAIQPDRR